MYHHKKTANLVDFFSIKRDWFLLNPSPSHPFELIFKLPHIDQQLHLQCKTSHMRDIPNEVECGATFGVYTHTSASIDSDAKIAWIKGPTDTKYFAEYGSSGYADVFLRTLVRDGPDTHQLYVAFRDEDWVYFNRAFCCDAQ